MSRLAASRARSDDVDGDVDDVHCSSLELCKPQNTDIPYSITIIIIIIIIIRSICCFIIYPTIYAIFWTFRTSYNYVHYVH